MFHIFSALALLSAKNEVFDSCWILDLDKKCFVFRFYKNRTQVIHVVIDDKIALIDLYDGRTIPKYIRHNKGQFFPTLFEKAYAKLYGSYSAIDKKSLSVIILN
jgi:hypothetical protein